MATATSTIPAFLDALRATLAARTLIAAGGVLVATAPTGEPVPRESIQLFDAAADQEWAASGNKRRREQYRVRGGIFISAPGAGEAKAKAARDRAFALLAEIEDALRLDHNVSGTVNQAQIAAYDLDQGAAKEGRWAAIEFFIAVRAELTSN